MPIMLLVLFPLVTAVVILAPGGRVGRWAFGVAALTMTALFVALVAVAPGILDGDVESETVTWVASLGLTLSFRIDGFGLFMAVIVSGIGALVFGYSVAYFRGHDGGASRHDVGRIAGLLLAFAGSMLGLVLADGFFTLFLFWEATSVTSFLLIGIDDRQAAARTAAQRALLVTGLGGLALLAGLVLLGQQSGTTTISALVAAPPGGTITTVALGARARRRIRQVGPVPVPLLAARSDGRTHAGERLPALGDDGEGRHRRSSPAWRPTFATVGPWRPLVVAAGGASLLIGGLARVARARRQAVARARDGEPARAHRDPRRDRGCEAHLRRRRDDPRPRALQGGSVPRGGDRRPPDEHPRHASARGTGSAPPVPGDRGRRSRRSRWPR